MLPKPTFYGKLSGSDIAFFRVNVCVYVCVCVRACARVCMRAPECPMHHCTLRLCVGR